MMLAVRNETKDMLNAALNAGYPLSMAYFSRVNQTDRRTEVLLRVCAFFWLVFTQAGPAKPRTGKTSHILMSPDVTSLSM
jgi:hypothetical protein